MILQNVHASIIIIILFYLLQGPDSIWGSRTLLALECDDESGNLKLTSIY